MVVTFLPTATDTGVTQERFGAPSRCTVQAPHWAMPQPNLVPVRPRRSRNTQRRGMSDGAFTSRSTPFTVSFMAMSPSGLRKDWLRYKLGNDASREREAHR